MIRRFSDEFDYNARIGISGLDNNIGVARYFIAKMRLDSLVYDKLVFTDKQLFHSLFLSGLPCLSMEEARVFDELPLKSIEIRKQYATLGESLLRTVVRADGVRYPHLFTYIDPTNMLGKELAGEGGKGINTLKELLLRITSLTRGTEMENRALASIESWNLWIDAADREIPSVETVMWPSFDFGINIKAELDKNITILDENIKSEYGFNKKLELSKGLLSRGDIAREFLTQFQNTTISSDEFSDLSKIESALSYSYNKVACYHHNCDVLITNIRHRAISSHTEGEEFRNLNWETGIPTTFLKFLANMPSKAFDTFLSEMAYQLRIIRRGNASNESIRKVTDVLVERAYKYGYNDSEISRDEKFDARVMPIRKLAIAGFGASFALPTVMLLLDPNLDHAFIYNLIGSGITAISYACSPSDIQAKFGLNPRVAESTAILEYINRIANRN